MVKRCSSVTEDGLPPREVVTPLPIVPAAYYISEVPPNTEDEEEELFANLYSGEV